MIIRPETEHDRTAIHDLTETAFKTVSYASGTEAKIIDRLRDHGALSLSLVAEDAGEIVGHVAFSPAEIPGQAGDWAALGPISVAPAHHRRGIARALVAEGLAQLRASGQAGCVLIGSDKIYPRLGFSNAGALRYRDVPARIVHWLSFDGTPPAGELHFHAAFDEDA